MGFSVDVSGATTPLFFFTPPDMHPEACVRVLALDMCCCTTRIDTLHQQHAHNNTPSLPRPPHDTPSLAPQHLQEVNSQDISLLLYGIANQGHDLVPDFVASLLHDVMHRPDLEVITIARLASAIALMYQDNPDALRQMAPLLRSMLYMHRSEMTDQVIEAVAVKLMRVHLTLLARCPDVVPLLTERDQAALAPILEEQRLRRMVNALVLYEMEPPGAPLVYRSPLIVLNMPRLTQEYAELPEYAAPSPAYADVLKMSWSTNWHVPRAAPPGVQADQGTGCARVPVPHSRSTMALHIRLLFEIYNMLHKMKLVDLDTPMAAVAPTVNSEILCRHQGTAFAIELDTRWTRFYNNTSVVRPGPRQLRMLIEAQGVPVVTVNDAMWDYAHTDKARADMLAKIIHAAVFSQAQQQAASV